jgi:hypothetical protein
MDGNNVGKHEPLNPWNICLLNGCLSKLPSLGQNLIALLSLTVCRGQAINLKDQFILSATSKTAAIVLTLADLLMQPHS